MKTNTRIHFTFRILGAILLAGLLFIPLCDTVEAKNAAITPVCIRYVNVNSSGSTQDGLTWGTAYKSLQTAIADFHTLAPCQIWVAQGTYTLTGTRVASFFLYNGISMYGGFVGGETSLAQRNWQTHETILSGEMGSSSDIADNAENVVYASYGDDSAVLDGFSIVSGYASGSSTNGAGICILGSSPTLSHLDIRNNYAVISSVVPGVGDGGGIFISAGSPHLSGLTIHDNFAEYGGGIYITNSSSVQMDVVTIYSNTAYHSGGGLYYDSNNTSLSISMANIYYNSALQAGGGAYIYTPAMLEWTHFTENSADFGGGLMIDQAIGSVSMTNSEFYINSATSRGGGIYIYSSSPTLTDVLFHDNSATASTYGTGGAISNYDSNPILTNVTSSGNIAAMGGGIFNTHDSHPVVRNSIFWGDSGGEYFIDTVAGPNSFSTSYSLIQGCKPLGVWNAANCDTDGGHNLSDVDPQFKDPGNEEYQLQFSSPAIDQGNNSYLGSVVKDLQNKTRIVAGLVDLGPYEFMYYRDFLPLIRK